VASESEPEGLLKGEIIQNNPPVSHTADSPLCTKGPSIKVKQKGCKDFYFFTAPFL